MAVPCSHISRCSVRDHEGVEGEDLMFRLAVGGGTFFLGVVGAAFTGLARRGEQILGNIEQEC